jgi:hypothetical protein
MRTQILGKGHNHDRDGTEPEHGFGIEHGAMLCDLVRAFIHRNAGTSRYGRKYRL